MKAAISFPRVNGLSTETKNMIDRFIYSHSHRLRSPLTSIEGLAILAEHCADPLERNKYFTLIQQCTVNMLDTITKLEEYTSVQNRQLLLGKIDTEALVKKVIDEYHRLIDGCEAYIFSSIDEPVSWLGDDECVYLLIQHLVRNSTAHSDNENKTRKISIDVEVAREAVTVKITDNGIRISPEHEERTFEPIYRNTNDSNGTGLDLSVVKCIAERLKATISLKTTGSMTTSLVIIIPNSKEVL